MNKQTSHPIILGVDPGTQVTGYGLIRVIGSSYTIIDFGAIRPPSHLNLSDRYLIIFDGIQELIDLYAPTVLVVETQYMYKNVQSAIKLGMARGVIMTAAKKRGLSVFGYAPRRAKQAVVGTGKASKTQVQGMVQRLLKLPHPPEPEDAADALALAICHAQTAAHLLKDLEI